jgi:hypothetical protein
LNGEINELKLFKFIKIYPYQQPFDHFLGLNDLHFNLDLKKNLPFFYNILPFFCFFSVSAVSNRTCPFWYNAIFKPTPTSFTRGAKTPWN